MFPSETLISCSYVANILSRIRKNKVRLYVHKTQKYTCDRGRYGPSFVLTSAAIGNSDIIKYMSQPLLLSL